MDFYQKKRNLTGSDDDDDKDGCVSGGCDNNAGGDGDS